jgi:hypothetical protein
MRLGADGDTTGVIAQEARRQSRIVWGTPLNTCSTLLFIAQAATKLEVFRTVGTVGFVP